MFQLRYGYKKPGYGYYTKTGMYLQRMRFLRYPTLFSSYNAAWDYINQAWKEIPHAKQWEVVKLGE